MNLIKIICGMLALALVLGVLTSGNPDGSSPEEPENLSVLAEEGNGGASIPAPTEEQDETYSLTAKSTANPNSTPNPSSENSGASSTPETINTVIPEPPNPSVLDKGESEMAAKKRDIENRIRATANLMEANGEEIFPQLKEEGSSWYHDGFYIFVWSLNGTQVVYPPDSSREGINMEELRDAGGKNIGKLFLETARSEEEEGWVEYSWPKTGASTPSTKYAFIKRAYADGRIYLIGSGFYLDEYMVSRDLEECKALDRDDGASVSELIHPENLEQEFDLEYSITHARVGTGESTAPRMMETPEVYYILEGEGILYIDGIPLELQPDQLVYIPAGSIQATCNTGNTSLKFLAINQPAWDRENEEIFD